MKFIIDIPEKDVQGCYSCPFNYDFVACVAPNGPDYVDIDDYLSNSFITTRPEGCPLVPVVPDQEEMDRNWPETIGELLGTCERLSNSRDLYTLGERGEPYKGESEPRVDGTDWLAGEYLYGVAMVPAQWVTHVLLYAGDAE